MPPNITNYKLICADHTEAMEIKVNRLIEQGYQPYGDTFTNATWRYVQPMVKYKPPQPQGIQLWN